MISFTDSNNEEIVFPHQFLTRDHKSVLGTTRRLAFCLESTGVRRAHRNVLLIFIYICQYSAKSHPQAPTTGLEAFVSVSRTFSQNYPTT
jgi:hypothetical protein